MRQLKPVIQDVADKINDATISNNIDAIKLMVILERTTIEAIQKYNKKKELINLSQGYNNPIVTGEDIRKEMNREIGG